VLLDKKITFTGFIMVLLLLVAGCAQQTASPSSSNAAPLAISTTAMANADVGIAYSRTVQASGGSGGYTWSISDGSLPTGFSLSARTGSISGKPLSPGTSNFTVQVVDSSGKTASRAFSITITGAPVPLAVRTSELLKGEIAIKYSQQIEAFGGKTPYSWSISGGALPDGLSLDQSTGVISGMPSATGKFFFTPQVRDVNGVVATAALNATIVPTLNMTTQKLGDAEAAVAYAGSIDVADGVEKYSWAITNGALPEGLTLDSTSGGISGQPKNSGNYTFTAQVKDVWGATVTRPFTLNVNETIALTTTSLPDARVGNLYSFTLQFKGGNGTVVWANASGTLPDGLDFDGNTGTLKGTPKTAGSYKLSLEVIDSFGAADLKDYTFNILQ